MQKLSATKDEGSQVLRQMLLCEKAGVLRGASITNGGLVRSYLEPENYKEAPPYNQADETLPECLWKPSVALDPRHRPQIWGEPSTTVRREWCRYPQEAHLLDEPRGRYRRLTVDEMAIIQGFPTDWFDVPSLSTRNRIRAIGDAVPPPLARAVINGVASVWDWKNLTAIEICAGAGGLASGANYIAGMKHVLVLDQWPPACEILRHRCTVKVSDAEARPIKAWPVESVRCQDVHEYDFSPYKRGIGLLSGGPPCQPWSQGGLRAGSTDSRDLLGYIHELVSLIEPEVFVFENVPGLACEQNTGYFEKVLDSLRNCAKPHWKYGVVAGILNAADFGVPQIRHRLFIIGFRDQPCSLAYRAFDRIAANATHRDPTKPHQSRKPWITLAESLGSRPDPGGWRGWITKSAGL